MTETLVWVTMPSKSDQAGEENEFNSGSEFGNNDCDKTKPNHTERKEKKKKRKKEIDKETPAVKINGEIEGKKKTKEDQPVANDQQAGKTTTDIEKGKVKGTKKKLPKWQYYSVMIFVVLIIIVGGIIMVIYLKPSKKNETNQLGRKKTSQVKFRTNRPNRKKSSNNSIPSMIQTTTVPTTTTPGYPSMPDDPWNYYEHMPSGACPPPYKTIKDLKEYYDAMDPLIDYCQNGKVRYQLPVIGGNMNNDANDSRLVTFLESKKIKHLIIDDASYGCRIVVIGSDYQTYDEAKKICKMFQYELVMFDTQVEKCIITRQIIEDLKDQDIWKNREKFMYVAGEQAFIDKERNLQFRGTTDKLLTGPLQFCKTPAQLRDEVFSKSTLLQTLRDKNLAIKMDDQQNDFGCMLPVDKSEQFPFMCKRCGKRKDCRYVCESGYNYKGFDCL